ncbi:hypothetical protein HOY82DRAFT_577307 [Tuber indicum]|nr:hypothetical protein HOY82DRAFT_577307 [Tuber indicum]
MAQNNYTHNAAIAFLKALLAYLEMGKVGLESRALTRKPELIGEPGEGAESGATVRDLSDGVEEDIHERISQSKDTSTASSGVTSHLPGVAVACPHGTTSSVNHSAIGDPVWPLQNSNRSACPGVQKRSTISSSSVTTFSTRFPDKNNNHYSPLTISIAAPTSGSSNNDSVPASSTAPAPVNAPTVVPVPRPVHKGNEIRLVKDIAGQLEDRIEEDPKGDIEAWLALIEEQRTKGNMDNVRAVNERFFVVFPAAADQLISYVEMELANNELQHVERNIQMSLFNVPNVELWSMYLDYTRHTGGTARAVVNQYYEFLLNDVGFDREAGRIWTEYSEFVKSPRGRVGGSSWQDQQIMDTLRKVFQRAVTMPVQGVESCLNKLTKHLQEYSPLLMTARYCLLRLSNITKGLRLDILSRLPPAPGYDGYQYYTRQLELWKRWIQWEKGDPQVLAKDDQARLRTRIQYVFNQALMALRLWPEMWFDAAEGRLANGRQPRSYTTLFGKIVRKEKEDLALIADAFELTKPYNAEDYDEDYDPTMAASREAKDAQVAKLRNSTKVQLQVMTDTISTLWINLMRATERVQGHGEVNELLGGSRQIFADARKRGIINSDVCVVSALIEYHCYKHRAALKIFGIGMRIFPEYEILVLEYLKFLAAINHITNASAAFKALVGRVTAHKARKLETRMSEIHPTDPVISLFSTQQCKPKSQAISPPDLDDIARDGPRYLYHPVSPPNGTANGPTVSQIRPPNAGLADSSEYQKLTKRHQPDSPPTGAAGQRRHLPRVPSQQHHLMKSRDCNILDLEDGMHRGGYGHGTYKNNQRQLQQHQPQPMKVHEPPAPSELATIIRALLSILPGPEKYQAARLRPEAIIELLCNLNLPDHV